MFDCILIANRGEIACRIIRTCRRLAIRTVAVHSRADEAALHVAMADGAQAIGPAPSRDSYLNIDAVLKAAKDSGAAAIHPGYGFLAENPEFAEACAATGVTFIGPPVSALRAMGSKSAAKALMAEAGVPVLPGYHGPEQDTETLREAALAIGYPVLLKPSAGGGGRGLRLVEREEDLEPAIVAARREALSSFADDRLLIEKYLVAPRHIEIQVFADQAGNAIHLYERDCSVQRRHQKVIEEAPAPGLAPATRKAMGDAAVAAARAVGYEGAGTVEFLLDDGGAFHFIEMNTRLQVEHPVTEMITGQDLVEWQIRVAAGQELPATQGQLSVKGHAIEARLYAEDPTHDFLPASGRLVHLRLPDEDDDLRIDTGFRQGDEVTPHYDPLIAKVIAWGKDRAAALERLRSALSDVQVAGVTTNAEFLSAIARHPRFAEGAVATDFLDREASALAPPPPGQHHLALAALAVMEERAASAKRDAERTDDRFSPWASARGWALNDAPREDVCFANETAPLAVTRSGDRLDLPAGSVTASARFGSTGEVSAKIDGQQVTATVVRDGTEITVFSRGRTARLCLLDPAADADADADDIVLGTPTAPMPGVVVAVSVTPGAAVEKGETLMVIEAMKVEHTVRASGDGTIDAVHFAVGDAVEEGVQLVGFTPATSALAERNTP